MLCLFIFAITGSFLFVYFAIVVQFLNVKNYERVAVLKDSRLRHLDVEISTIEARKMNLR